MATAPTTIDLFSGAGGITEGFRRAGFDCLFANDSDTDAIQTISENHPDILVSTSPVQDLSSTRLRRQLCLRKGDLDVLVGGPPCQGFSINAPGRFLDDPRNSLFRHYLRFVADFAPKYLVFENVPGLLSFGDGNIFHLIQQHLGELGYSVSVRVLFAAHYGVPQERWRLIILGSRSKSPPSFPFPTHFATGRANFRGGATHTFRLAPSEKTSLAKAVTLGDAIDDLPRLQVGEGAEELPYDRSAHSSYAGILRTDSAMVLNHYAARLSPQNMLRMSHIPEGGSWRDIPYDLLPEGMKRARRSDHTKRYGRLRRDGLASTIMTKCDPHWGPVFLPDQNRSLTVREAARVQSFPDVYRFYGCRVSQYRQVGNAVPPLLAHAIAAHILTDLTDSARRHRHTRVVRKMPRQHVLPSEALAR